MLNNDRPRSRIPDCQAVRLWLRQFESSCDEQVFEIAHECCATTVPMLRGRNEYLCVSCAWHAAKRLKRWFWSTVAAHAKPRTHRLCAAAAGDAQQGRAHHSGT